MAKIEFYPTWWESTTLPKTRIYRRPGSRKKEPWYEVKQDTRFLGRRKESTGIHYWVHFSDQAFRFATPEEAMSAAKQAMEEEGVSEGVADSLLAREFRSPKSRENGPSERVARGWYDGTIPKGEGVERGGTYYPDRKADDEPKVLSVPWTGTAKPSKEDNLEEVEFLDEDELEVDL